jgi:hypothetical protein
MLRSHAEPARIDIADVDEKAFRFFVMAEIKRCDPNVICQPEWKTVDLVVQTSTGRNIAIEFKFYVLRRAFSLDAAGHAKTHWKGGAGKNNKTEFAKCVKKLRELPQKKSTRSISCSSMDGKSTAAKSRFKKAITA